jgi:hypothetical protein
MRSRCLRAPDAFGRVPGAVGVARFHVWSIEPLAKDFGASREAVAIKCVRSGLERAAMIVWESATPELDRQSNRNAVPSGPLRIKFACCGRGFEDCVFPRGCVASEQSLVQKIYGRDGWTAGEEDLPTSRGPVTFRTESQVFQYLVGDMWERKVITFVFAHA